MKHAHVICKLVTLGAMLGLITGTRAYAGGPRWIAGSSYFNSSAKGKPVVWANGQVSYYLDLGSLSATVTNAQARTMIANSRRRVERGHDRCGQDRLRGISERRRERNQCHSRPERNNHARGHSTYGG